MAKAWVVVLVVVGIALRVCLGEDDAAAASRSGSWHSFLDELLWGRASVDGDSIGNGDGDLFVGDALPDWIEGAGVKNELRVLAAEDLVDVMMHRSEIALILSYLKPSDVYLEWGSGGSTLAFGRVVSQVVSIEHNCPWAEHMQERILRAGLENKTILHCSSVPRGSKGWGLVHGFEHGSYRQFKNYVDAIDDIASSLQSLRNESSLNLEQNSTTSSDALSANGSSEVPPASPEPLKFDKVLIDGRARMACALKILPYLKPSSVVFIHDFYTRAHLYGGVMEYYDEVARVLASPNYDPRIGPLEEPQGLVVLKKKTKVTDSTLPLSEAQINARYDRIDFRDGDPVSPVTFLDRAIFFTLGIVDLRNWKRIRTQAQLYQTVLEDIQFIICLFVSFLVLHSMFFKWRRRSSTTPRNQTEPALLKNRVEQDSSKAHPTVLRRGQDSRAPQMRHRTTTGDSSKGTEESRSVGVTIVDSEAVSRAASRREGKLSPPS